jgi:nucleoside-diphosphate-sugar epimerase/predicted dehydrogenase
MRVAIVGCGQISRSHISALRSIEEAEICGVCDRDAGRATDLAGMVKGARAYRDVEELLAVERPEVVHVLTPPRTHAAIGIQAMKAGCHLLVEKPMAVSQREAEEMVDVARTCRVTLCTNHNYLFKPSVLRARRLVSEGALGRIVSVFAYYGLAGEGGSYGGASRSHWAWRLPGSVFTNFLPHLVYLEQEFLRGSQTVSGVTISRSQGEAAADLTVLLEGEAGCGTLQVCMRAKPYAKFVEIYGTKGILHVDLVRELCVLHRDHQLPRMLSKVGFGMETSLQAASGTIGSGVKVVLGRMKSMPELPVLFHEFYASIRNGAEAPVPGERGKQMVEVLERIWQRMPEELARPAVVRAPKGTPHTDAEREFVRKGIRGKVLVTGATGRLGHCLVAALARCGAEPVALVRDRTRVSLELESECTLVSGDVRDPDSLQAAMRGIEVVYHCAAVTTNQVPWSSHHEINVLGTENILRAALAAGVQRVVHVSSVVVYGMEDRPAAPVAESDPYGRDSDRWAFYFRSKTAAERSAFAFSQQHRLPVTIVRLGILYGTPGTEVKDLLALGRLRLRIGSGRNFLPLVFIDNAVDALLLAAITPEAIGQAYNIVDEPQIRRSDLARQRAAIAGEEPVFVSMPALALSAVARLFEWKSLMSHAEVPPRLSRFIVRSSCRNIRYDTSKASRELGWHPVVPLEEALKRC